MTQKLCNLRQLFICVNGILIGLMISIHYNINYQDISSKIQYLNQLNQLRVIRNYTAVLQLSVMNNKTFVHSIPIINQSFVINPSIIKISDGNVRKIDVIKKEDSNLIEKNPIRVAYVFAGSARSFVCAKVHWSLKSHLIDAMGGIPYVFVRIATEDNKNIKTGLGTIWNPQFQSNEINETLKVLNPMKVKFFSFKDQLEEMKQNYPEPIHDVFREHDLRRYSMFYHRTMAYRMLLEYEQEHGIQFDWVVLTRLDAQWLEPVLPITAYASDRVWITETGYDVFNDQFMLIPRQFSNYLYDLNTKVKKSIYCLGGPDVETWKCDRKELMKKGISPTAIDNTLDHCCKDMIDKTGNRYGYSERIHFRHLREGKIPVGIGRFPVYLVRLLETGSCYSECMRLARLNFKEYMFLFNNSLYAHLLQPVWPDTRARGISSRDDSLCLYLSLPIHPWKPEKAVFLHTTAGVTAKNTGFFINSTASSAARAAAEEGLHYIHDYSKSLHEQPNTIHPSVLINPKDTEVYRIHPTWNVDGCLTYSFKLQQLVWSTCNDHSRKVGGMYDPRQLFFVYVIPHTGDPSFESHNLELQKYQVNHETPLYTRIMIPNCNEPGFDFTGTMICLTAQHIRLDAPVIAAPCTKFLNDSQLFLTVTGIYAGSHPQTTIGKIQLKADPTFCVAKADRRFVDSIFSISTVVSDPKLYLAPCILNGELDHVMFEFELTRA